MEEEGREEERAGLGRGEEGQVRPRRSRSSRCILWQTGVAGRSGGECALHSSSLTTDTRADVGSGQLENLYLKMRPDFDPSKYEI